MKLLQRLKNLFLPEGKISDGFHSFDELYHYRMLYNAAFFNSLEGKYEAHKSYRHADGSRWNGYKVGDNTNAFYSPEDVIAIAKEVCKARFLGNWKLKIVDYSGKDLDSEILISEL